MKQRYNGLWDWTKWTHQVEDQNNYLNCHQSDFPKTTDQGESQGSLEEEGSPEVEDSPEEVEDSPEAEDIQGEEECHLEDHPEEAGDHPHSRYHKPIKES